MSWCSPGDIVHGRTTTISDRPANAWPRLGGGPAFVAAAARRSYHGPVVPVSWVGSDELGKTYIEQLAQRHISSSGMVRLPAPARRIHADLQSRRRLRLPLRSRHQG